jgi:nucleotide-binding universal stress UspA family protein
MIRRIVFPSDFSKASRAAFAKALETAKSNRAQLTIVHVMSPVIPMAGDGYVAPSTYESLLESNRRWAKKRLDALTRRARARGVRVKGVLLEGVPHEAILRAARRADLIVMGTHGRTGVARFFLGSVAGRVVAGARCPVLTVRGR